MSNPERKEAIALAAILEALSNLPRHRWEAVLQSARLIVEADKVTEGIADAVRNYQRERLAEWAR